MIFLIIAGYFKDNISVKFTNYTVLKEVLNKGTLALKETLLHLAA